MTARYRPLTRCRLSSRSAVDGCARLGGVAPAGVVDVIAELGRLWFPAGSMGPKVEAAADFARTTGKEAVIGALSDLSHILNGTAGTQVSMTMTGIAYG